MVDTKWREVGGSSAAFAKNPRFRPNPDDIEDGISQVCGQASPIGSWIWRRTDEPGVWRRWGSGEEVPVREWRLIVPEPERELAQRRRVEDAAKVQTLIAAATAGPSQKGEEAGLYHLREHPGGMAVVCHRDGSEMSPLLAKGVAEGILAELAGEAEDERNEDDV